MGLAGDSIASALWANGHRVMGYSVRKRRPRGLDANVTVAEQALGVVVAEQTPLTVGMDLRRVHRAASLVDGLVEQTPGGLFALPGEH